MRTKSWRISRISNIRYTDAQRLKALDVGPDPRRIYFSGSGPPFIERNQKCSIAVIGSAAEKIPSVIPYGVQSSGRPLILSAILPRINKRDS